MEESRHSLSLRQAKLLSELRVGISVEMGMLEFSLDDLLDLLPGNTFEFTFDPLREFPLRLGGEVIGAGVFALVGEQLVLKVVSVASTPSEVVRNESQPLIDNTE